MSRVLALLGATIPSYVLSLVLILVFAVWLRWLPAFGSDGFAHLILPTITLAAGSAAQIARLTRASLLEVLQQDYVRTARSKGLAEGRVIGAHAFRNALLPVVTALGLTAGNLLGGVVVVETIFSWYGIGKYAVDAIFLRDYPVIQATALYFALVFVALNFFIDLLYRWIDPKLAR
jgi:ABC-type dipeptide/oligopeptide/nickel transport system permease component